MASAMRDSPAPLLLPSSSPRLLLLLLMLFVARECGAEIGDGCKYSYQCGTNAHCHQGLCRRARCTLSSQCQEGELCRYGKVDGKTITACFPEKTRYTGTHDDKCPGGGSAVIDFKGNPESCDLMKQCSEGSICNPKHGVCCTKLRTCIVPEKPMLNVITGKPIICRVKMGRIMPCPKNSKCNGDTGFCCTEDDIDEDLEKLLPKPYTRPDEENGVTPVDSVETIEDRNGLPLRGEHCSQITGCGGDNACVCVAGNCRCECPSDFGYTVGPDGRTCVRVRRRLREKCKTDMECSAAFSECSSGGCRCKVGFQRDGAGGCKPINYQCVNKGEPLKHNDEIFACSMRAIDIRTSLKTLKSRPHNPEVNSTGPSTTVGPSTFVSTTATTGFCCPMPDDIRPVCPVGVPHESSSYPDFGCRDCPTDHFCHRDGIATDKEICCPKPCVSLEDIYVDGQCYSIAYHGDSCHVSEQCRAQAKTNPHRGTHGAIGPLVCIRGVCDCEPGYNYVEGVCARLMCSVGLRSEPSVDRHNNLIRCDKNGDCSQGQICDPNNNVCCRGQQRCPKGYMDTGETCLGTCTDTRDLCYRPKLAKEKICCRPEEQEKKTT